MGRQFKKSIRKKNLMKEVTFDTGFKRGTLSRLKIGGKQRENISGRKDRMNKGSEEGS